MNRFIQRLGALEPLSVLDTGMLERATAKSRCVESRTDLVCEGGAPGAVHLILDGFACRYKMKTDGGRTIMALLVPGDFCDLQGFILGEMDHSIATLSSCKVVELPKATVVELFQCPSIAWRLWWATLADEAILREWLVRFVQLEAKQRIAHLFCELLLRLRHVGLAESNRYGLPITQLELGEMVGVSTVHVNRSLQALRQEGLITFGAKQVVVLDHERLIEMAEFNPSYLHFLGNAKSKSQMALHSRGAEPYWHVEEALISSGQPIAISNVHVLRPPVRVARNSEA